MMPSSAIDTQMHAHVTQRILLLPIIAALIGITVAGIANIALAADTSPAAAIVQAYGGREALGRIGSLGWKGKIEKYMPPDAGSYYLVMKRPGRLLVDIAYSMKSEKRLLLNGVGYRGKVGQIEQVTGMPFDAMVYQYNQMDLPFGLADGSLTATLVRQDTLNGRDIEVMDVVDRSGNRMEIFVDKATHAILRTAASFGVGSKGTVLSADLDDYRIVDGVPMPFLIINYAGTMKISEIRVSSYTMNVNVNDTLFAP